MKTQTMIKTTCLVITGLILLSLPQASRADTPKKFLSLQDRFLAQCEAHQYREAEATASEMLRLAKDPIWDDDTTLAWALSCQGKALGHQGRYEEAASRCMAALETSDKILPSQPFVKGRVLIDLADVYENWGAYSRARSTFKQALDIFKNLDDEMMMAKTRLNLASACLKIGLDAEAMSYCNEALETFGERGEKFYMGQTWLYLANAYRHQGKRDEAEAFYRRAQRTFQNSGKKAYAAQAHFGLAEVYAEKGGYKDAEVEYNEALNTGKEVFGDEDPDAAKSLNGLAFMHYNQGRYADAEPLLKKAISMGQAPSMGQADLKTRARSDWIRAMVLWAKDQRISAVEDLNKSIDLLESLADRDATTGLWRASLSSHWRNLFELMVCWRAELKQPHEVFRAMERCRARSLLDQMETVGTDQLAGVLPGQADKLRDKKENAERTLASLTREQLSQLCSSEPLSERVKSQLDNACEEYSDAESEILRAVPSKPHGGRQRQELVALDELKRWSAEQETLVLEYLLGSERGGSERGYVLVVRPDGQTRAEELIISDRQAKILGVKAGSLTADRMRILLDRDGWGTLKWLLPPHLADPEAPEEVPPELPELWKLLVPETERAAIQAGQYRHLGVIADASMADLPFEILVVESGDYLLDAGPPVFYAPSATILMKLAKRKAGGIRNDPAPVLTVADPKLGEDVKKFLRDLEFADDESAWVAEVFGKRGFKTVQLTREGATEKDFRNMAPGRRVIHVASHGMFFPGYARYGNLVGLLPLTEAGTSTADDDGFLMLPEFRDLDLKTCELAILSACVTRLGQEWGHEGTWSISREVLGVGARRVVSTHAPVYDQATACLMSVFCGLVAEGWTREREVDYAEALQKAKQWIRKYPEWKNRVFWAPFTLTGPP